VKDLVEQLTKEATKNGKLIELGWLGLRHQAVPDNAPQIQIDEMRTAFFAGAHHLFASIMTVLDPGVEPTSDDLKRMSMIQSELDEFVKQYKLKYGLPS
jgi:hypothetical protein